MCTIDSVWCHSPKKSNKKKPPASHITHLENTTMGLKIQRATGKSLHHKTRGRDHHFCFHRNNAQAPGHRTSVLLKDWPMNIGPIFCTESGPRIQHPFTHSDLHPPKSSRMSRYKKGVRFQKGTDRSSNHYTHSLKLTAKRPLNHLFHRKKETHRSRKTSVFRCFCC